MAMLCVVTVEDEDKGELQSPSGEMSARKREGPCGGESANQVRSSDTTFRASRQIQSKQPWASSNGYGSPKALDAEDEEDVKPMLDVEIDN
eukprot:1367013-Amphidinium_carterae.1